DDTHIAAMDEGVDAAPCAILGMFLYFCALSTILWWFMVNFNLMFALLEIKLLPTTILQIIYHTIGWGVPLLGLILGASYHRFGGEGNVTFCFITYSPIGDETIVEAGIWMDAIYYIPMGILTFLWFPVIGISLYLIGRSTGMAGLRKQRRLLCFVGYVAFLS